MNQRISEGTARKDLYAVLGVSPTASHDEIRGSYRKLAKELHPDTGATAEQEHRFRGVSEAWAVLSDPAKKAEYDGYFRTLHRSEGQPQSNGARQAGGSSQSDLIGSLLNSLSDNHFGTGLGSAFAPRGTTSRAQQTPLGTVVADARRYIRDYPTLAGTKVSAAVKRLNEAGKPQDARQLADEYADALVKRAEEQIRDYPTLSVSSLNDAVNVLRQLEREQDVRKLFDKYANGLVRHAEEQVQGWPTLAGRPVTDAVKVLRQLERDEEADKLINKYANALVNHAEEQIRGRPTLAGNPVKEAVDVLRLMGRVEESDALIRKYRDAAAKDGRRY